MKTEFIIGMYAVRHRIDHQNNESLTKVLLAYNRFIDQFLQDQIKEYALPKIKGELTKGKLKWRGISLAYCPDTGEQWVLQRGKQIGKKYIPYHSPNFKIEEPIYFSKETGEDSFTL